MEQYIPKSALLAEIDRLVNSYDKALDYEAALEDVRDFLDTLEVKEVDLEKELKEFLIQYYNYDYPKQYQEGTGSNAMPHIVETAKYFFNLGLKAQKGEEVTDKVQKIREEVEKLKSRLIHGACVSQIAMETRCKEEAYNEVLAILDTIQEEPKPKFKIGDKVVSESGKYAEIESIDTDKYWCKGENGMSIPFKYQDKWELVEEPVSEDLEEAADNALNNVLNAHEIVNVRSCLEMFKTGAKWQKTKDESITEDLGEYINELSKQFPEVSFAKLSRIAVRVAKWQKEQIMAKAIGGGCFSYKNGFVHISCDIDEHLTDIKMGDKVKVIVIKED